MRHLHMHTLIQYLQLGVLLQHDLKWRLIGLGCLLHSLLRRHYILHSLSIIWIETNHKIVMPRANHDLAPSRSHPQKFFPLTKNTRQVLENEGADVQCERRRGRRVGVVAVNSGQRLPSGAMTNGRLPDPPCRLGHRDVGVLSDETVAGVGGITLDYGANAEGTALFAGVRGGIAFDLTDVREASDGGQRFAVVSANL